MEGSIKELANYRLERAKEMQLGEDGNLIRNITLFAVLVYEIVGPLLTKQALTAAGDITPMPEHVVNRRETKLKEAKEMKAKKHQQK